MSTNPIDADVARLVRVLKSDADIQRGIRVDKRIANDGNVIIDDDLGLIRMIENIDANRADMDANTISLIDKLNKLAAESMRSVRIRNDYATSSGNATGIGNVFASPVDILGFSVNANTIYQFLAHMDAIGSATDGAFNGALFGLSVPTGATIKGSIVSMLGNNTNPRQDLGQNYTGLNGTIWAVGFTSLFDVEMRFTITTGASNGVVLPLMAVQQAGDTITVKAESNARIQIAP